MNKDVEFDDVVYTVKQTRYFGKFFKKIKCNLIYNISTYELHANN